MSVALRSDWCDVHTCPTGVTPYLVAGRFKTGWAFASDAITLSTILAVASVAFWLRAVEWF